MLVSTTMFDRADRAFVFDQKLILKAPSIFKNLPKITNRMQVSIKVPVRVFLKI
jgi:hypothetical protein